MKDRYKIITVIPARNEEENLPTTITALLNQSYNISKIIVVNDGSTDRTEEVCKEFQEVEIINRKNRGYRAVGKSILAETFNDGFKLASKHPYDFILIIGADTILSFNYVEQLIKKFDNENNLVMASGLIDNEKSSLQHVRGTGRLIKSNFWKEIGEKYPVMVGWESYPIFKAGQLGYSAKSFPEISMKLLRPTGKRTDYFSYGLAMRAFGYFTPLAIGRILKTFLKSPKSSYQMFKGYCVKNEQYEKDLRKYIKVFQRKRLIKM
jgi:glycosyltransferase involved in cell wall biosynthesis